MRRPPSSPDGWARTLCFLACATGPLACQPSSEQIDAWKGTEKGPGKLAALLADDGASPPLRARAAAALIEIGQGEQVEEKLDRLPEQTRKELVHLTVPLLINQIKVTNPSNPGEVTNVVGGSEPAEAGAAATRHQGGAGVTTRAQAQAKDGLFRLRLLGSPVDRDLDDQTLVAFLTADLAGRLSTGSIGTEQILAAVGAPAAPPLLAVLENAARDATPAAPGILPAAALLRRIGDPETKQRGAAALIRMSDERIADLANRSSSAQRGGPLQPRISGAEGRGPSPTTAIDTPLRALGVLGGPTATAYLQRLATRGPLDLRQRAFGALGESGDASAVDLALRLARDPHEAPGLRESAFTYLERAGQIAVPGLLDLIKDPGQGGATGEIVRFRAVEAALSGGRCPAIGPVLAALPTERAYSREDLTAYVVHQITPLGAVCLPAVREGLQSRSWVARAAALLAIGELAGNSENIDNDGSYSAQRSAAPFIGLALLSDPARLRGAGWQAATIGDLAQMIQQLHRKR